MSTIDERVVEMKFDNKDFESNVKTSLGTLDKLKEALNLKGASDGIKQVEAASSKFNLAPMVDAAMAVQDRFSAMGIFASRVLENIADTAFNAGSRIVSALTTAPLMQGWGEYELQQNSIQTIMASTGQSLETVTGYLNELNTYADKTIYSFSDMTANIGKFTNAGVSLDKATAAIQGVSNVAAVSGANTEEASRAMYNFAQALSQGSVKLVDWKSIENANMATVEFKNELIKTALAMGTLTEKDGKYISTTKDLQGHVSEAFTATSLFNDSLSSQWMTTDVLVDTLQRYTDETTEIGKKATEAAQKVTTVSKLWDALQESLGSGWTKSWTLIVGNYNEASEILTEVFKELSGIIDGMSEWRNSVLEYWRAFEGRQAMIEGIAAAWNLVKDAVSVAAEPFKQLIGSAEEVGMQLALASKGLRDFFNGLSVIGAPAQVITEVMSGLVNIIQTAQYLFRGFGKVVGPIFEVIFARGLNVIAPLAQLFDKLTLAVKKFVAPFRSTSQSADKLREAMNSLMTALRSLFAAIRDIVTDLLGLDDAAQSTDTSMRDFGTAISNVLASGISILAKIIQAVAKALRWLADKGVFSTINAGLDAVGKGFSFIKEKAESLASGAFEKVTSTFNKLGEFVSGIGSKFDTAGDSIGKFFTTIKNSVSDMVANVDFMAIIDSITKAMGGIANIGFGAGAAGLGAGIFTFAKTLAKGFSFDALIPNINSLKDSLKDLADTVGDSVSSVVDSVTGKFDAEKLKAQAGALKEFAIAIGILTVSLVVLSGLDADKLAVGLGVIAAALTELVGAYGILNKIVNKNSGGSTSKGGGLMAGVMGMLGMGGGGGGGLDTTALTLIALAGSVLILSFAMTKLAALDWDGIAKGLTAVGVLMLEMIGFVELMTMLEPAKLGGTAVALIGISVALLILSQVVAILGTMDTNAMAQGLIGIAFGLGIMVAALYILSGQGPALLAAGAAVLILSIALIAMAGAIYLLGSMDPNTLGQGLIAMAGGLLIMGIALTLIGPMAIAAGAGLLLASVGMLVMAAALFMLQGVDLAGIASQFMALGPALIVLALGLAFMTAGLVGAIALTIAAAGLTILGAALKVLPSDGPSKLMEVSGALIVFAIGLTMMTAGLVGAVALTIAAAGLVVLATALRMLNGLDMGKVGGDLMALALALTAFSVAAAPALLIGPALAILAAAFLALAAGMTLAGAAMTAMVSVLTTVIGLIATLISAFVGALQGVVGTLTSLVPSVVQPITEFTVAVTKVVQSVLLFASSLMQLAAGAAASAISINALVAAFTSLVTAGASAVASMQATMAALNALIPVMATMGPSAQASMDAFTQAFVQGLNTAQTRSMQLLMQMLKLLVALMAKFVPNFRQGGQALGAALAIGIHSTQGTVNSAVQGLLSGSSTTIRGQYSNWYSSGQYIVNGLIAGLQSRRSAVINTAAEMGTAAHNAFNNAAKIASPSKLFFWSGQMIGEGVVRGMQSMENAVASTSGDLADSAMWNILDMVDAIQDAADNGNEIRFTPVIDSSKFNQQLAQLNGTGFGVYGKAMAGNLTGRMTNQFDIANSMNQAMQEQERSTAKALAEIRSDIDRLASRDADEFAIYLDSRKVASTMAKPMDRALGIRAKRGGLA